jgi:uncharacterized protein (DUF1697 family)
MTARFVSLLRGINVGGHNRLPMADLRAIYEAMGCEDVTTYLQSGNVVFRRTRPGAVPAEVEAAIRRAFGLDIRVLGRTHDELARVVAADPFPGAEASQRLVMFLSEAPSPDVARGSGHVTSGRDEALLVGMEVHLHCPDGLARTKLMGLLSDRRLGVAATARNWRTVTSLRDLSAPNT